MPLHIIWGNDLNACNKFIQKIIDQKVSKTWGEINVSYLNGDEDNQMNKHLMKYLPPLRKVQVDILKNKPIFTNNNEK